MGTLCKCIKDQTQKLVGEKNANNFNTGKCKIKAAWLELATYSGQYFDGPSYATEKTSIRVGVMVKP